MSDNSYPVGVRRRKPVSGRSEATGAIGSNPIPRTNYGKYRGLILVRMVLGLSEDFDLGKSYS